MSKTFIPYEESMKLLNSIPLPPLKTMQVALPNSVGMYLSHDIVAPQNDPVFPTASMDGYACRHQDLHLGILRVLGDNPAGNDEQRELHEGECIKTFTGSKMPQGSDTLIPIENVTYEDGFIKINEEVPLGFAVRPIGEGYKKGEILIHKGTKISYVEVGVLAALGVVMVDVVVPPHVAVLATGSEILNLGECSDNPATIRSSNNYTIAALCQSAGAKTLQMGTIKDDKESILHAFQNAISSSDIIISTGGVSVGDYDFVKDIVPALGFEVVFHGVAIKPGRHIMVAQKEGKVIIALPGFAYSSTVTAILYALPLIAKMLQKENPYTIVEAQLKEEFKKRTPFSEFRACNVEVVDGKYYCDFEAKKVGSSAILVNMLHNAGIMIAGVEDTYLEAGTMVRVILAGEL
ncbi:MAG: molybdopterin molybdotransferase MoeA [Epsilonproteobacteria bacterium]|nr:molybdopterin molybdotransferase MoeA [Campylobacterota bacterium]